MHVELEITAVGIFWKIQCTTPSKGKCVVKNSLRGDIFLVFPSTRTKPEKDVALSSGWGFFLVHPL